MVLELLKEANKIVNTYVSDRTREAMLRVERERTGHPRRCGCLQCAHQSVDDVNSWIDFIAHPGYTKLSGYVDAISYHVIPDRGSFKIIQGTPCEDGELNKDLKLLTGGEK